LSADRRFSQQNAARCTNVRNGGPHGSNGPEVMFVLPGKDIVYIHATSTRECTFRALFASECA
jgi:hypothetical protein